MRLVVVIFDLGLGQRGLFDRRPHHGLGALIERAVHQELHELVCNHRLGVIVHGQIGIIPIAGDAQTLEFLTLDADPFVCKGAAFLTEVDNRHFVLVLALLAVLLFDLPFDGQTVAVPPRHIARIKAQHLVGPDDHVLDRLVQRVTDVQVAVGVRRAIVQREGLAFGVGAFCGGGLFAQLVIHTNLRPTLQPAGLALGQARAHREISFGQIEGVCIFRRLRRVGTHVQRPLDDLVGFWDIRFGAIAQAPLPGSSKSVRAPGI